MVWPVGMLAGLATFDLAFSQWTDDFALCLALLGGMLFRN
jgi:hypothetical protein